MCSVEGIKARLGGRRWDLAHLGRRPTRGPIPVYGRRSFEPLTQVYACAAEVVPGDGVGAL